jgi:hypothetical protein
MKYARRSKTDRETAWEEYEQDAILYLLKRFNDFDLSRGVRYFNMAPIWIIHAIQRAHFYKAPTVRRSRKSEASEEVLIGLYREEPTPAELEEDREWKQRVQDLIEDMATSLKSDKQRAVFRKLLTLPSGQAVGKALGSTRQNIDEYANRILQNLILWTLDTDNQAMYEILQTGAQGLVFRFMASKPSMFAINKLSKLIQERNLRVQYKLHG